MPTSVRNRLFAVTAGMALVAGLSIGLAYAATESDRLKIHGDARTAADLFDLASQQAGAIRDQDVAVDDYLLRRDPASIGVYREAIERELRLSERMRSEAVDKPDVEATLEALASATSAWRASFAETALAAVTSRSEPAIARVLGQVNSDLEPLEAHIATLSTQLRAGQADIARRDEDLARTRQAATVVGVGLMLLSAAASLVLLRRWVMVPLARLVATATRVEAGEDLPFVAERDDEIGKLGLALEGMRRGLAGDTERSTVLNRFTEVTTFAADDTAVAAANLEALRMLVKPDFAVTHVLNQSKDRAIPEATLGGVVGEVLPLNALSHCPGIVRGSIYVTPNVAAPLSVRCPIYLTDHGTVACVPLAHGEVVGAVHLAWDRVDAFPLQLRASVSRIAEHAALAIANRRLLAALQGMATTDARTGLANTRSFDQAFEDQLAARGEGESVAVLMIDIDHFKDFNDRYGHPAGDEALRAFADILRSCLRDGDLAGRYGGEEFAVLLPKVDESVALVVAERIRSRTETTLISLAPGITDRLTVSVGVACAPAQGRDRLPLMRLADEALYRAKDRGRNRVEYIGAVEPAAGKRLRRPAMAAGAVQRRRRASRRPGAKAS